MTNAQLVKDLPHEFQLFMQSLQKLGYADEPDYDYLRKLLLQVYTREGYPPDAPFDWERKESIHHLPPSVNVKMTDDEKPKDGKKKHESYYKIDERRSLPVEGTPVIQNRKFL